MPLIVPNVKKKNTLRTHDKKNSVVNAIVEDTKLIVNYNTLRADFELIERVCNLIEDMIKNNKNNSPKLSKKEMCIEVFRLLFPNLTPDEVNVVEKHIEYLWNNDIIKPTPLFNKIRKSVFAWVKKKVLN